MSDESAESVEGTGSPDSHDNPDNPDSTADAGTGRDWSELNGAYGPATEVPEALAGLTDPDLADDAIDDLYSVVLHQGTLYSASGPAVVEVARLLAADRCADPTGALGPSGGPSSSPVLPARLPVRRRAGRPRARCRDERI